MLFADQVKNDLLNLIQEMSAQGNFSKEPGKHFSRKRKLDFSTMMHFILSMEAGSLKKELHKYFSYNPSSASASAFIQQRSKLSDNAFPHLFRSFNSHYTYSLYKREYQLLAVDGSTFTYTRNERDQDSFFPPNAKSSKGYNQVHVVSSFDLLSKRYTDCIVQPIRKKNEFDALTNLIDRHIPHSGSKSIFIADRGFHSFNVFAHAIEHQAYFVIRATDVKAKRLLASDLPVNQDTFDICLDRILSRSSSRKNALHPELSDQYRTICKKVSFDYIDPKLSPEYPISLRVLRFQISEDNYEYLITNLPPDEFSLEEIKELYHLRWGIETSFRELKYIFGTANFHSKKREFIEMEIWARILLYNFCSIITDHVAVNRKGKKHMLQVNYSVAYDACHYLLRLHGGEESPKIESLLEKNFLPIRPNRKYARQHRFRVPVSFLYRYA